MGVKIGGGWNITTNLFEIERFGFVSAESKNDYSKWKIVNFRVKFDLIVRGVNNDRMVDLEDFVVVSR